MGVLKGLTGALGESENTKLTVALFFILSAAAFLLHLPFMDPQIRWAFEPDSFGNIEAIKEYYYFIQNPFNPHGLQPLKGSQTYLDGAAILTAIFAHVVHLLIGIGVLSQDILVNDNSLFIFSFQYSSLLFISLAVGFCFLCIRQITKNSGISLLLVSSGFLINQFFSSINFLRVDHYLLFSSVFFFYGAFKVLEKKSDRKSYVIFALATVLCTVTKLNTPMYLTGPGLITVFYLVRHRVTGPQLSAFSTTILLFGLVFFMRWLIHPYSIIPFFKEVAAEGQDWYKLISVEPYFYFHFYNLYPSYPEDTGFRLIWGVVLVIMYVSISILCLLFNIRMGYRGNVLSEKQVFLLIVFFIHSIGLILAPKIHRYGQSIPFYYLLFITFCWRHLLLGQFPRISIRRTLFGIVLLMVGGYHLKGYWLCIQNSKNSQSAYVETKINPRKWILENLSPSSKLAAHNMEKNCTPPIWEEGFDMSPSFLNYMWLDSTIIYKKLPPVIDSVVILTDVILLSNYNYDFKPKVFGKHVKNQTFGLRDPERFSDLRSVIKENSRNDQINQRSDMTNNEFVTGILSSMWIESNTFEEALFTFTFGLSQDSILAQNIMDFAIRSYEPEFEGLAQLGYTELLTASNGNLTAIAWKQFYDDLPKVFCTKEFSSEHEYYQIRWQKIIIINEEVLTEKSECG